MFTGDRHPLNEGLQGQVISLQLFCSCCCCRYDERKHGHAEENGKNMHVNFQFGQNSHHWKLDSFLKISHSIKSIPPPPHVWVSGVWVCWLYVDCGRTFDTVKSERCWHGEVLPCHGSGRRRVPLWVYNIAWLSVACRLCALGNS